jgi:hypothetical protein
MTISYAPEVIADNSGKWCGNALRFATEAEAQANVRDLAARWYLVRETRVVESHDPINYRYIDGKLIECKTFTASGNWGELTCDVATGDVLQYDRAGDYENAGDGYDDIVNLDSKEWQETYPEGDISAGHDILDFGSTDKAGRYVAAESDWRFNLWLDREGERSGLNDQWRIVPKLGAKARAAFVEWLKALPADHYIDPAKALANLENE